MDLNAHQPTALESVHGRLRQGWEHLHRYTSLKNRRWWALGVGCLLILVLLRALLPLILTMVVNHRLAQPGAIQGSIDGVGLSLIRGVYTIEGLHLTTQNKVNRQRVPLIDIAYLRCAVAWSSLVSSHWTGALEVDGLALHLNATPSGPSKDGDQAPKPSQSNQAQADSPSYTMADWRRQITGLVKFEISNVEIRHAQILYVDQPRALRATIGEISGTIKDLIVPAHSGRRASFHFGGTTEGHGDLAIDGTVLVSAEHPQADVKAQLVGVDLPKINHISEPYEGLIFKSGIFSGYLELAIADDEMRGEFKPIFTRLSIDSYRKKNGSGASKLF